MRINLIEKLKQTPLVFDGAMGTMIYNKGVFVNTCYDQLNLTNPNLIKEIHQQYIEAGADVIETNSFGANRIKLKTYGLAEQVREINLAAAKIAREVAGEKTYVVGSVGPCLRAKQLLTIENNDEIKSVFKEQIQALKDGGVDAIILETFSNIEEIKLAACVAKELGLSVIASMSVLKEGETAQGQSIKSVIKEFDKCSDIDAVGINCTIGPAGMFSALERSIGFTEKPYIVQPNAGVPQEVEGRMIYMSTPEYFTTYCQNYIRLGARGIGGCCGTTPEHIKEMAKTVKSLTGVKQHLEVKKVQTPENPEVKVIPVEQKSKFAAKIARGEKVTSIEITPPRSVELTPMLEKVQRCKEFGIDAINIPDGPRASARISPMVAAMVIEREVGMETVLHYCCRDRNLIGMQSDILGGYAAGLRNYLIITGDPPKLGEYPDATAVFDVDAVGLTKVVHNLNRGVDIGGNLINPPTGILIGVGANPCAVDIKHEIKHFCNKVDAGAEFAITQPVFNPDDLLRFLDIVAKQGKSIPVIAGVWPLVSYRNAAFLRDEVPGVEVPDSIMERMSKAKTKEEGKEIGIEIAREIRDKISDRVGGFQVSAPFGNVEIALNVLE